MSKAIAFGSISFGDEETTKRSCRGAEPIVDVVLERIQPETKWLSLAPSQTPLTSATFVPSLAPVNSVVDSQTWGIVSVAVTNGGLGHKDGDRLVVSVNQDRTAEVEPADLFVSVDKSEPVFSLSVADSSGEGGELSLVFSKAETAQAWSLDGVTVVASGSGYKAGEQVIADGKKNTFNLSGELAGKRSGIEISKVSPSGGILAATHFGFTGEYYYSQGKVQSVSVDDPGEYYATDSIKSLLLVHGGSFLKWPLCKFSGCWVPNCASNNAAFTGEIVLNAGHGTQSLEISLGDDFHMEAIRGPSNGHGRDFEFDKLSFFPGVKSASVTSGGDGYSTAPQVSILSASGKGAQGFATVKGGVSKLSLVSGGAGYSSSPTVSFSGGGGLGAQAAAFVDGAVSAVSLEFGGVGYTAAPSVSFLGGGGGGAKATASIFNGSVSGISVVSGGSGYSAAPAVSLAGGGGTGASATAVIQGSVTSLSLVGGGHEYTAAPSVSFLGGGGSGASATAQISAKVTGLTITSGGRGYDSPPTVAFSGGGGTGATAVAVLEREPSDCPPPAGIAKVSPANCQDACMPEQILFSLDGLPLFVHTWNTLRSFAQDWEVAGHPSVDLLSSCGVPDTVNVFSQTWSGVGKYYYGPGQDLKYLCYPDGVVFQHKCTAVLDLQSSSPCLDYLYYGVIPRPPWVHNEEIKCGGELDQGVQVHIARVADTVSVSIAPPTSGEPEAATATAEAVVSGDQISSVKVTDGGAGYATAVMKSSMPTIKATVSGTGTGAVLAVNLISLGFDPYCQPDGFEHWTIGSISVTNGGGGYASASSVSVEISPPTKGDPLARATAKAKVTTEGGSVSTVAVTEPGSGYAVAVMKSAKPTINVLISEDGGAYAEATLVAIEPAIQSCQPQGYDAWTIESVYVWDRGAGYSSPTASCEVVSGFECSPPSLLVTVGEDGGIDDVTVEDGGIFWAEQLDFVDADSPTVTFISPGGTGALASANVDTNYQSATFGQILTVDVLDGGAFYSTSVSIEVVSGECCLLPGPFNAEVDSNGAISSVPVPAGTGGVFWGQELDHVEVDSPAVSFGSLSGSGATATAKVDGVFGSPNFGKVVSVDVTSGGSKYSLADGWLCTVFIDQFDPFSITAPSLGFIHKADRYGHEPASNCLSLISARVHNGDCPLPLVDRDYEMNLVGPWAELTPEGWFHCGSPCRTQSLPTQDVCGIIACGGRVSGAKCTLSPA